MPDVVEGDRFVVEVGEADCRGELGERVDEVVVDPEVAPGAVVDAALEGEDAPRGVLTVKDGKFVSHDIQAAEKKVLNITLESTNPGGHSSVPVKDNAITHLSNALVKIGAFDFPVHLNDITLPKGVTAVTHGKANPVLVSVVTATAEEAPAAPEAAAAAAPAAEPAKK